jgi:drug/metabolite transporter (DMT)-like permease
MLLDRGRWVTLICVVIMTIGQILFKKVAVNYNREGSLLSASVLGILIIAGIMYVVSTGLWIWALRSVDISKAYPFFALGFVLIPMVGAWLFGESFTLRQGIGTLLIVAGVAMSSSS